MTTGSIGFAAFSVTLILIAGTAVYFAQSDPSAQGTAASTTRQVAGADDSVTASLNVTSNPSSSTTSATVSSSSVSTSAGVGTVESSTSDGSTSSTTSHSSSTTTTVITSTNGAYDSNCTVLADTNSTDGLTMQTYLPSAVKVGDSMCAAMTLENDNQTTISSLSGNMTVTDAQGNVVFQSTLVPFEAGSLQLTSGNQLTFQFLWNTTYPYHGVTPQAGAYTVHIVVQFDGLQPMTYIESYANLTLAG